MIKRILPIIILFILVVSGCSVRNKPQEPIATPTLNPNITHPEGKVYDTNPPSVEGLVTAVDEKTIKLNIQNKAWEFELSEQAKNELKTFREKHNIIIEPGSFIEVKYEKTDSRLIANNFAIVKTN